MTIITTPLDYYYDQCAKGNIIDDAQQLSVMKCFQQLHHRLCREYRMRSNIFAFLRVPKCIQGLYIWGSVGAGKTFMMDSFYYTMPINKKLRMHFHQFMQWIHDELKKSQGEIDPLKKIARKIAKNTIVLCFDEFIVSDIVDAILLGKLFSALFSYGVCIVATSNMMPDELYKNGLQRKLFLPTIAMIKKNMMVLHLKNDIDYRLRHVKTVKTAPIFYSSQDIKAEEKMNRYFSLLSQNKPISFSPIEIGGRLIKIKQEAQQVIWFDFNIICSPPRSSSDYLEIAKKYHTIFISDIPIILAHEKDIICLFIRLIDILYNAHIRLVCSTVALALDKIYAHGFMSIEYKRTYSRLLEMQSDFYFHR